MKKIEMKYCLHFQKLLQLCYPQDVFCRAKHCQECSVRVEFLFFEVVLFLHQKDYDQKPEFELEIQGVELDCLQMRAVQLVSRWLCFLKKRQLWS